MLNFIFLCLSCSLNIFMAYLEYKICPFCKCFSSHCMDSLFLTGFTGICYATPARSSCTQKEKIKQSGNASLRCWIHQRPAISSSRKSSSGSCVVQPLPIIVPAKGPCDCSRDTLPAPRPASLFVSRSFFAHSNELATRLPPEGEQRLAIFRVAENVAPSQFFARERPDERVLRRQTPGVWGQQQPSRTSTSQGPQNGRSFPDAGLLFQVNGSSLQMQVINLCSD